MDEIREFAKATQTERVLAYMEDNGAITPIEALAELGVMRLASRISDLKRLGVPIAKKMVKRENRYGEPVSFAEYSIAR